MNGVEQFMNALHQHILYGTLHARHYIFAAICFRLVQIIWSDPFATGKTQSGSRRLTGIIKSNSHWWTTMYCF